MVEVGTLAPRRRTTTLGAPLVAAVVVGVLSGLAGAVLTLLLHLVQHLAFGYTENTFLIGVEQASPARRVLAMAVGGLVVGFGWWRLRLRHDIEEVSVTRALRDPEPTLPLGPTVLDAVLQVVAVGAGGSLGREGAPRQTAAALAEAVTRRWPLAAGVRRTLVACGAGAGLAAVYNVPAAGALFALEVLLVSRRPRDVLLAVVSSGVATVVAWPVVTTGPTYQLGSARLSWPVLALALFLGPTAGLLGVGFVRLTTLARTHAPTGAWTTFSVTAAFAVVGALAIAYPQLLGNGKGQAQLAFTALLPLATAAALVLLKPAATSICLAGGAIGGLLTPSLATGASLGALAGGLGAHVWPHTTVAGCAVVGAATLLAVTQRAPLTAVVFTFELMQTGAPMLLPVAVAVVLGVLVAVLVDRQLAPTWWEGVAPPRAGRR